jgi:polyphenol oxidase
MPREEVSMTTRRAAGLPRQRFLHLAGAASAAALAARPRIALADDTPLHCAPPTPPGPATPWSGDYRPIQTRPSASTLSVAYLAKLRNAYAAMRALPANDPRSFQQQANIHGWWCGGCGDGKMAPGGGIHYHWTFFLWHRAYLYFHEKILGKLIGDTTFRLPYWDWDTVAHMTMPAGFTAPASASNSLYNGTRFLGAATPLDASAVGSATMNPIYALTTWNPFGGGTSGGGAVEDGPHGYVHVTVGGDMGAFATAAMDPIFYAHHCNVDRAWAHWHDDLHQPDPPASYFGSTAWTFYDENKNWISIKPSDVLDHANQLRYNYNTGLVLHSPFPRFSFIPRFTPIPQRTPIRIFHTPFPLVQNPIWNIPPGPGPLIRVNAAQQQAALAARAQGARIGVALQGIQIPPGVSGILDITAVVGGVEKKVGYVAIVPDRKDGTMMHAPRVTAVVDVTGIADVAVTPNSTTQFRLRSRANAPRLLNVPLRAARGQLVAF